MRTLIVAAGRFGEEMRREIAAGREPRLDVFELARALGADVLDYLDVDRARSPGIRLAARTLGASAAVAYLAFEQRGRMGRRGHGISRKQGSRSAADAEGGLDHSSGQSA